MGWIIALTIVGALVGGAAAKAENEANDAQNLLDIANTRAQADELSTQQDSLSTIYDQENALRETQLANFEEQAGAQNLSAGLQLLGMHRSASTQAGQAGAMGGASGMGNEILTNRAASDYSLAANAATSQVKVQEIAAANQIEEMMMQDSIADLRADESLRQLGASADYLNTNANAMEDWMDSNWYKVAQVTNVLSGAISGGSTGFNAGLQIDGLPSSAGQSTQKGIV